MTRQLDNALPRLRANENSLTYLGLNWEKIGAEGAKAIADALKSNTNLSELWLYDNKIGDVGAKALAQTLKSNSTLTKLDLGCNQIGAEGAIAIADALKSNTSLIDLRMDYNGIGAEGAKAFVNALTDKRTSAFLHLRNNVGKWSAALLADAVNYNRSLTVLNVFYNLKFNKQIEDLMRRNKEIKR